MSLVSSLQRIPFLQSDHPFATMEAMLDAELKKTQKIRPYDLPLLLSRYQVQRIRWKLYRPRTRFPSF